VLKHEEKGGKVLGQRVKKQNKKLMIRPVASVHPTQGGNSKNVRGVAQIKKK